MKHRRFEFLLFSILTVWLIPASIKAQDFQRTYPIDPGGQIRIRNISGDVKVSAYGGNLVEVTAFKEGLDRDKIFNPICRVKASEREVTCEMHSG